MTHSCTVLLLVGVFRLGVTAALGAANVESGEQPSEFHHALLQAPRSEHLSPLQAHIKTPYPNICDPASKLALDALGA